MTDLIHQLETMASKHPHMRVRDALARLREAETRARLIAECRAQEPSKRTHGLAMELRSSLMRVVELIGRVG
jgi:indole-3-glycerol phosphate synthase